MPNGVGVSYFISPSLHFSFLEMSEKRTHNHSSPIVSPESQLSDTRCCYSLYVQRLLNTQTKIYAICQTIGFPSPYHTDLQTIPKQYLDCNPLKHYKRNKTVKAYSEFLKIIAF